MINHSRRREKMEGIVSRRRTLHCSECGKDIQADSLNSIPEIDRVCSDCRMTTGVYTFVNKRSGKELQIRAPDAELATLRAWGISPNLTLKIK